ncbi:MAG: phosphoribosyl-ATP diphosphatase [Myxococcales bacterium]|nr:phosphoribosyl-ATP diphosphatase [Myxococcales bacterium]
MIVGSVDIRGGHAVQLVGGEALAIDAGDPTPWVTGLGRAADVAIIDLDAAIGTGSNEETIRPLLRLARCRVGGGIRSAAAAIRWLDAGADKVILGTAATPEVLSELPADRVIAALDARHGEVVVEGWRRGTGATVEERMAALAPYVGGFLVTLVESEGRLGGIDMQRVAALRAAAGARQLTVAGGVTTPAEVAAIDRLGADCQVGMALYSGRFDMADALAACLTSDRPDGLWPTVVVDRRGNALGLVYSSVDSLRVALRDGVGAYWSRKRGLWVKGATSNATQRLVRVDLDCDRDSLRFVVDQTPPGFCHTGSWSCFGGRTGLDQLASTLAARAADAPRGSYTRRLLDDAALLRAKLHEEVDELLAAETADDAAHEAADVVYFALVAALARGADLGAIEAKLDERAMRVSRRPGNAKPNTVGAASGDHTETVLSDARTTESDDD